MMNVFYPPFTPNARLSPEGALLNRRLNKTGAISIKGTALSTSNLIDNAVKLQSGEYDTCAIMYSDGIDDGQYCWVAVNGIVQVLIIANHNVPRESLLISSITDGRAESFGPIPPPPTADIHFKEVGHSNQEIVGEVGIEKLCWAFVHFN